MHGYGHSMKHVVLTLITLFALPSVTWASDDPPPIPRKRHAIGSSVFVLYNLIPDDQPPSFYQLNYKYRLTTKDTLSAEAITWTYHAPLGIPYGSRDTAFPGSVRAYGLGVAYQRFLWNQFYSAIHVLPLAQTFRDENKNKIQSGFQLFFTVRFGYHFEFFKNRVFLEPSVAFTSWPINTNLPDSFTREEDKWPMYFLFEPGLHVGVNF